MPRPACLLPVQALTGPEIIVSTAEELRNACAVATPHVVLVGADVALASSLRVNPGVTLRSLAEAPRSITFAGVDGLQLTQDNTLVNLRIVTDPQRCALWNDPAFADCGTLSLCQIVTVGRVSILARGALRSGHIEVDGLDIVSADARGAAERPQGYGVSVVQGAFTLWNMQQDPSSMLTANLIGLSAGRSRQPVRGGGIFVGGGGESGGVLRIQRLDTGAVCSDGGIAAGTADLISGGVFVVSGAEVDQVTISGPVTTFGQNDMVLDVWGKVDRWHCRGKITSYGPSGVGFVNFGMIRELFLQAPLETFGKGARGFNVYTGTVVHAEFDRIVTHGDGAVGVQISQPIGALTVHHGIETFGGTGDSLVKGVIQQLPATALSFKEGGAANRVEIRGGLTTHGHQVAPLELFGTVDSLSVEGGFRNAPFSTHS